MVSRADRLLVTERAQSRCEYCRAPQIITGSTYHIDYIIPLSKGGAEDASNYALCCVTCNGHKSDHTTGVDPGSGKEIRIFDPRRDQWTRHFRFHRNSLTNAGFTAKGRATVARLQMNERKQTDARALWMSRSLD